MDKKPPFLLDVSCGISKRDNIFPKTIVHDMSTLEELREAKDSIIKQYLDKNNQILITSDYRFGLKMVISGKKIIFVENEFNMNYFHIVYPSIRTGKSMFWKPDVVEMLRE